jgi:Holliday junction resolvase-like predicted endonuclease
VDSLGGPAQLHGLGTLSHLAPSLLRQNERAGEAVSKWKQKRGEWGEDRACEWLVERGFEIVARRQRFPAQAYLATANVDHGWQGRGNHASSAAPKARAPRPIEVDILARREAALWICEVKTFQDGVFQLLTPSQKQRLEAVRRYLKGRQHSDVRIALMWIDGPKVEFLENP